MTVERVLVVPRVRLLDGKIIPNGFSPLGPRTAQSLIKRIYQYGFFSPRPKAEKDPSLKQIIPYLMVACRGKIFTLHRLARQTEVRLHHKYSLGVGGHINPESSGLQGIIEKGLERELNEELALKHPYRYKLIGYLNDDTNSVGSVHFGLVYHLKVKDINQVAVAEREMMAGRFMTPPEIKKVYPLMETWSQILFKAVSP